MVMTQAMPGQRWCLCVSVKVGVLAVKVTLAVVRVSYSCTLVRQDTFCAALFFSTDQIIEKAS